MSSFEHPLRSRYVQRGKNERLLPVEAGILIENGSEPNPTMVGKPWNDGRSVVIILPMVAQGSHLGNVDSAVWQLLMERKGIAMLRLQFLLSSLSVAASRDRHSALSLEHLESRLTPAVSVSFNAGLLSVIGDSTANDLSVTYTSVSSVNYVIVKELGVEVFDGRPFAQNLPVGSVTAIVVDGAGGDDLLRLEGVAASNGFASLDGAISIVGGLGNDSIVGSSYFDQVDGGADNDSLQGNAGDDWYLYGSSAAGSDTLNDSSGMDLVFFGTADVGVSLNLSLSTGQSWGDGTITIATGSMIESVYGSDFGDSLTGNSLANVFFGAGGDDTLAGGAGDDFYAFFAEANGSDSLVEYTDEGQDFVSFLECDVAVAFSLGLTSSQGWGDGTVTLSSASTFEGVVGGVFNDTLSGGSGSDILVGGAGDDSLTGGLGDDFYIFEGSGNLGTDTIDEAAASRLGSFPPLGEEDSLIFTSFSHAITIDLGVTGNQPVSYGYLVLNLTSATGIEDVAGTAYGDYIIGNETYTALFGLGGNDTIYGGVNVDFLLGGAGNDYLDGGSGSDAIFGDDHDLSIAGGNDTILGGNGRDILVGGDGADCISGGSGDDILISANVVFGDLSYLVPALMAIHIEWIGGNTYANRVDNILSGSPDPDPIPSEFQFNPGTSVEDLGDGTDSVNGGGDNDWFLVDASVDSIEDLSSGEIEIDI
jgi:Ca2+-binding RTX toxin-like protein